MSHLRHVVKSTSKLHSMLPAWVAQPLKPTERPNLSYFRKLLRALTPFVASLSGRLLGIPKACPAVGDSHCPFPAFLAQYQFAWATDPQVNLAQISSRTTNTFAIVRLISDGPWQSLAKLLQRCNLKSCFWSALKGLALACLFQQFLPTIPPPAPRPPPPHSSPLGPVCSGKDHRFEVHMYVSSDKQTTLIALRYILSRISESPALVSCVCACVRVCAMQDADECAPWPRHLQKMMRTASLYLLAPS